MAAEWNKLTVVQLKEELTKHDLDTSGKKSELVSRMTAFSQASSQSQEEAVDEETPPESTEQHTDDAAEDDAPVKDAEETNGNSEDVNVAKDEEAKAEIKDEEAKAEIKDEAKAEIKDEVKAAEVKDEEEPMEEDVKDSVVEGVASGDETKAADGEEDGEGKDEARQADEAEDSMLEAELGKDTEETGQDYDTHEAEEMEDDENFLVLKWTDDKVVMVPIRDQIKNDVVAETECRSVVVFPVLVADLQSPVLVSLMDKCLHFNVDFRASWSTTKKTTEGYVDLLFGSYDDAKTAADEAGIVREGVEIKHLGHNDSRADLFQEWKKKFSENTLLSRLLYVGNIPLDTTEAQLCEIFPASLRAILPRKESRELRGYGYIEYTTEEEVAAALEKVDGVEVGGQKVCVFKCMKDKPEGMLTDKQRDNIVRKVRGIRSHLKFNSRNMRREDHMHQKTLQRNLLEKLRVDTKVRRENNLLNPEQLKKIEFRETRYLSQLAEANSEGRRLNPAPQPYRGGRGGHQPRGQGYNPRGRGSQPWTPRGGPQGGYRGDRGGGNWRGGGRGWGGNPRGHHGEMSVAMDLLSNLSHALHGPSQSHRYGDNSWRGGHGNQGGGSWGGKRRASDEGFSDWKRRGGDGGRRGGYRGRGNWNNY